MSEIMVLPPLQQAFEGLPDPRVAKGRRYTLTSMLVSAVCAMLNGARGVTAISQWTRSRGPEELRALGFERRGLPCPATYWLLFEKLDTVALELCLMRYFRPLLSREDLLAVDGKTLRGSRTEELPAVHLLSVFGQRTQIVYHQRYVPPTSSEIDVIIPLLSQMDLGGRLVTADALHAQRRTADFLSQRGLMLCWS